MVKVIYCQPQSEMALLLHPLLCGFEVAGEHALDTGASPCRDAVTEFFEKLIPTVIDGEEEFCRARNMHAAEYKT